MLTHPTLDQLRALKLDGMAQALVVSQLGERLWEDYQAFAQRDLSEYEVSYLFIDGLAERLRPGAKREPVLAAWGFTVGGPGYPVRRARSRGRSGPVGRGIGREQDGGAPTDHPQAWLADMAGRLPISGKTCGCRS